MTEWKEYKLSDLLEIKYGKDHKHLADGPFPLYGSGGIMRYVEKPLYEEESILIPRKGTLSNLFYMNEPFWSVDTLFWSKINRSLSVPKYLYYTLKTFDLASLNVGSAVPSLTTQVLNEVLITLPDLPTQTAIAEILSSLDDKIELNNKINKDLEALAQALFKQWFIDFEFPNENGEPYKTSGGEMVQSELGLIPKGWSVKMISDILINIKESTNPGVHLNSRKYVPIDKMAMKSFVIKEFSPAVDAKSSLVLFDKGDILLGAMRVYFHRVNYAPFNGVTRTTCFVLKPKLEVDLSFLLVLLNREETIQYANSTSKGTTMPYAVWDGGLSEMQFSCPNKLLRENFNNIVLEMIKTISNNANENIELSSLRDTLLPKLISGELKVSEVQIKNR